ncbi:hypothetical protein [Noviherbaspirillum aridicola]|uniref:Uncharacterized protein n=1 Tax=Noviherbaspirillum aridicola TaxID=2849687 RepID=A0ABQ4Q524_9BURK|nr:hypothetical protein [Noviherbaspirillum aridicola]GIZ51905.1 hypothetical protein NCCP691_19190 [Noviherbaspirillum aridicola]
MKALMIEDLAIAQELTSKDLAGVVGGCGACSPGWGMPKVGFVMPKYDYAAPNVSFDAAQSLGQSQNTTVNNGNNVAFSSGISANVNPTQNGQNTINFG